MDKNRIREGGAFQLVIALSPVYTNVQRTFLILYLAISVYLVISQLLLLGFFVLGHALGIFLELPVLLALPLLVLGLLAKMLFTIFWALVRTLLADSTTRSIVGALRAQGGGLMRIVLQIFGVPQVALDLPRRTTAIIGMFICSSVALAAAHAFIPLTLLTSLLSLYLGVATGYNYGYNGLPVPKLAAWEQGVQAFTIFLPLAGPIMLPLLVWLSSKVRDAARYRARFSLDEAVTADPRAPILFLRAFEDDHVTIPRPRDRITELLAGFGWRRECRNQRPTTFTTPNNQVDS